MQVVGVRARQQGKGRRQCLSLSRLLLLLLPFSWQSKVPCQLKRILVFRAPFLLSYIGDISSETRMDYEISDSEVKKEQITSETLSKLRDLGYDLRIIVMTHMKSDGSKRTERKLIYEKKRKFGTTLSTPISSPCASTCRRSSHRRKWHAYFNTNAVPAASPTATNLTLCSLSDLTSNLTPIRMNFI